MSIALTALFFVLAPPALFPQRGPHHSGSQVVRRLAVELPGDALEAADSSDGLSFVVILPDDAVANAPHVVPIVSEDGKPRDPAAFPIATPRRGPPLA